MSQADVVDGAKHGDRPDRDRHPDDDPRPDLPVHDLSVAVLGVPRGVAVIL